MNAATAERALAALADEELWCTAGRYKGRRYGQCDHQDCLDSLEHCQVCGCLKTEHETEPQP